MLLAQGEAERLIAVPKRFVSAGGVTLPPGVNRELAAECDDPVERFIVDVRRSGATLHLKHREQLRARRTVRGQSGCFLIRRDGGLRPGTGDAVDCSAIEAEPEKLALNVLYKRAAISSRGRKLPQNRLV